MNNQQKFLTIWTAFVISLHASDYCFSDDDGEVLRSLFTLPGDSQKEDVGTELPITIQEKGMLGSASNSSLNSLLDADNIQPSVDLSLSLNLGEGTFGPFLGVTTGEHSLVLGDVVEEEGGQSSSSSPTSYSPVVQEEEEVLRLLSSEEAGLTAPEQLDSQEDGAVNELKSLSSEEGSGHPQSFEEEGGQSSSSSPTSYSPLVQEEEEVLRSLSSKEAGLTAPEQLDSQEDGAVNELKSLSSEEGSGHPQSFEEEGDPLAQSSLSIVVNRPPTPYFDEIAVAPTLPITRSVANVSELMIPSQLAEKPADMPVSSSSANAVQSSWWRKFLGL